MNKTIFFVDGSAWPNPKMFLHDEISDADKNRIVEAYYVLVHEITLEAANYRIKAIKKYLKDK